MIINVECLRSEHIVGKKHYPLFIGYMTANQLKAAAEAPHFRLNTPHHVIAKNADDDPVLEWQRPVDDERVKEIARIFRTSNEIMPNAVLLAAQDPTRVKLTSQGMGRLWKLSIHTTSPKALWVLDGQHRIAGLDKAQSKADIPFVLLASHDSSAKYQDSTFAKIFAQVTTTAEGLHDLHNEWLTYAFKLGKYDPNHPTSGTLNKAHRKSMKTAIHLCDERFLDTSRVTANPFFDRVAFNPKSIKRNASSPIIGPSQGGFLSDAMIMEAFVYTSYYGAKALPAGELPPDQVAKQFGLAYEALVACHPTSMRSSSVLLTASGTSGSTGHKALQDGFVHGVLRYLAEHGSPADWETELKARAFDTTDWSAAAWASNRTGSVQTLNKKIARRTFEALLGGHLHDLFLKTVTIPPVLDLGDYFSGAVGAGMEIQGRRINGAGRKLKFSKTDPRTVIESGKTVSRLALGSLRMVSVGQQTPNVQEVSVIDEGRPRDGDWSYPKLKPGLELSAKLLHRNPLKIEVAISFYGGETRVFRLDMSYS
jgi:DGQHR domain-containing protein